ncbi:hypothetical protein ACROYT_G038796 [Oculina patagonica]
MEVFDVAIPVGSPLCNSCRKSHKERVKNEWKWLYEGVVEKPAEEGDLLLQEEVSFLNDKRRDKEVEDIFNNVGVMHPMMYDGYDICEQTKQEGLSKFNVKTLKAICDHFELPFKSKDTKATLVNKITGMVKECSCCRATT